MDNKKIIATAGGTVATIGVIVGSTIGVLNDGDIENLTNQELEKERIECIQIKTEKGLGTTPCQQEYADKIRKLNLKND